MGCRLLLNMRQRYFKERAATSLSGSSQEHIEMRRPVRKGHDVELNGPSLDTAGTSVFSSVISSGRVAFE
jgi:hypothetical protein